MKSNRREFLSNGALFTGSVLGGMLSADSIFSAEKDIPGAERWNQDKAVRRDNDKLLKIGGIFGLWSHTSSTWWRYLNPPEGKVRPTGMRITHLWCIDQEAGRRLAERYDAQVVEHYDDMIGQVDGMFIDDFYATPFMPDLSLPYLEAGIPCFFDRPMASSMSGAMKVINTSKRSGTPFMVASAYEYLKEVEVALRRMKEIGDIRAYEVRNSGSTIYQYALHGLWFTLKVIGVDVERIGCMAEKAVGGPSLTTLIHRRDDSLFYGTMHQASLQNIMCSVCIYGSKGDCEITAEKDGRSWYLDIYTYLEMLHAMERMIRTKEPPETIEYTEAKMRIFLSLLYSLFEKDGDLVTVASLPESWDAGPPKGFSRSYSDEILNKIHNELKNR